MKQADPQVLADLVENSGLDYKKGMKSYILTCPRCDKKKLYLRRRDGKFVCWVCRDDGFWGWAEYALKEMLGLSLLELRNKLYGSDEAAGETYIDVRLKDFFSNDPIVEEDEEPLAEMLYPLDYYPIDHRFSAKGRAYLEKRGVTLATAARYGLHYCPPTMRVIFPVQFQGVLYGWQARATFPTEVWSEELDEILTSPKIITSDDLKRERLLMFMDNLVGTPHAVLGEGPFDAIKADLCGGNVASMGKSVNRGQLQLIRNAGVSKVYLALDPDAAEEAGRLSRELGDLEMYLMEPSGGYSDFGEMPPEGVLDCFHSAIRISSARVFVHLKGFA